MIDLVVIVGAFVATLAMIGIGSIGEYFIQHIWFKRLGPAMYYLITGDAKPLPNK